MQLAANPMVGSVPRTIPTQRVQTKIEGRHISIPMFEWCSVWTSYQMGRIRALDVRTWLALREVAERRKFLSRGREALYKLTELESLVGKIGEVKLRASLRRLKKAGLASWSAKGPKFLSSTEELKPEVAFRVKAMLALMPPKRKSFPMPRRVLRLLGGGVKKSVLATMIGQLIWCVYFNQKTGWLGVGSVSAKSLAQVFGLTITSIENARRHLREELGWLRQVERPMWHIKKYGGTFEVNLAWSFETPAAVGEGCGEFSTAEFGEVKRQTGGEFGELESEQPSSTKIKISAPRVGQANPRPRDESSRKDGGGADPSLRKLHKEDLRSTHRVMELFAQALKSPLWKSKGWTPTDSQPERINWAASARRALVRGGTNPCGLFLHLVTKRKWAHISNDDEDAIRQSFNEWRDGVPEGSYRQKSTSSFGDDELVPEGYLQSLEGVIR